MGGGALLSGLIQGYAGQKLKQIDMQHAEEQANKKTRVEYLKAAAASLRSSKLPPPISPVQAALEAYGMEVSVVRSEGLTRGVPGDVAERFFALGFSLEQMRQNLKDLERCVAAWADAPPVPRKETTGDAD